jgi:hypothetical protein
MCMARVVALGCGADALLARACSGRGVVGVGGLAGGDDRTRIV